AAIDHAQLVLNRSDREMPRRLVHFWNRDVAQTDIRDFALTPQFAERTETVFEWGARIIRMQQHHEQLLCSERFQTTVHCFTKMFRPTVRHPLPSRPSETHF